MPWVGAAAGAPKGRVVLDLGSLLLKLSKNLTRTLLAQCVDMTVWPQ